LLLAEFADAAGHAMLLRGIEWQREWRESGWSEDVKREMQHANAKARGARTEGAADDDDAPF
jgi:hypothetical protein